MPHVCHRCLSNAVVKGYQELEFPFQVVANILRDFEAYVTGFLSCRSTPPRPCGEASTSSVTLLFVSK